MYLLRFKLVQMYNYINTEITRSSSSFLIFYTPIYYIINIKFTYKTPHKNPYMRYAMIIRMYIEIHILNQCNILVFANRQKIKHHL
jgi:hypothetical protein